jgi:long-chain acyl-CoA synthetase
MYPGKYAQLFADRPAFIMAGSGQTMTHGELEGRSNRLAHLLRAQGGAAAGPLRRVHGEQQPPVEACVAGEPSGLYYTCINGCLQADEPAYILNTSESRALVSRDRRQ